MSPGLLKSLIQTANFWRSWPESQPEKATEHGRSYLGWLFLAGLTGLLLLTHYGVATPEDLVMFMWGILFVELLQFGTLIRLATLIDPLVGGVLGALGLEFLTRTVRGIGATSAAISYFNGIWE